MNNGAFGENFPYTNFHDLNMDWIIKIAKDFLDQYTHIQETITQGLEDLDEKANTLQALLQAWYDEHSADIANQLASALEDLNNWYNTHQNYLDQTLATNIAQFNQMAEDKARHTIETIPDDYTELAYHVDSLDSYLNMKIDAVTGVLPDLTDDIGWNDGYFISANGTVTPLSTMTYSNLIPVASGKYRAVFKSNADDTTTMIRIHGYVNLGTWVRNITNGTFDTAYGYKVFEFDPMECTEVRISMKNGFIVSLARVPDDLDYINMKTEVATGILPNLADNVHWNSGYYINASGETLPLQNMAYSDIIPVKNGFYRVIIKGTTYDKTTCRIHGYTNGTWNRALAYGIPEHEYDYICLTINTAGCDGIRFSVREGYLVSMAPEPQTSNDIINAFMKTLSIPLERGTINTGDGVNIENDHNRYRTPSYLDGSAVIIKSNDAQFIFAINVYERDNSFIGAWNGVTAVPMSDPLWMTELNTNTIYKAMKSTHPNPLLRLIIKKIDNGDFTLYPTDNVMSVYANEIPCACISVFENWAVCGASYDSGNYDDGTGYNTDHINLSWGQTLARRSGNNATNYTQGGWNTNDFLTSPNGMNKLLSDPAKDFYVIDFGGNDATSLTIGTISDITSHSSWTDYPNTFYGNMGKIIEQIEAHAPRAKLVLTTPPSPWYTANQLAVDNAVREIANHYSIPVVEWESDPFMRSSLFVDNMQGIHPTPIFYSGMALAFERLFSKCVEQNVSYFNN